MQTVFFSDTRAPRSNPQNQAQSQEAMSLLKGKRVVVIEDEGVTQMQLRKILTRAGLTVVGAAMSGPEGVEIVLREMPDLVLMDIQMPGAYDGLEAAQRILAQKSVCVVMLTAFSEDLYRERAKQLGTCGFVVKPIDQDTLFPQLETAWKLWQPQ